MRSRAEQLSADPFDVRNEQEVVEAGEVGIRLGGEAKELLYPRGRFGVDEGVEGVEGNSRDETIEGGTRGMFLEEPLYRGDRLFANQSCQIDALIKEAKGQCHGGDMARFEECSGILLGGKRVEGGESGSNQSDR